MGSVTPVIPCLVGASARLGPAALGGAIATPRGGLRARRSPARPAQASARGAWLYASPFIGHYFSGSITAFYSRKPFLGLLTIILKPPSHWPCAGQGLPRAITPCCR